MNSTTSVKVLLAGTGTAANKQDHQARMYLPAVQNLDGFEVAGVWAPDVEPGSRAAVMAGDAGVPLISDVAGALDDSIGLVIICPDPARPSELAGLLQQVTDAQVPVLIDKPTLLSTASLTDLAQRFPTAVAAHHPRFHPALTATRGRIASGGLGLLHAVHGELLVGPGDGPHPAGELRNLAAYALDVVQSLIGDLHGRGHAVITPPGPDGSGESIALSLRCSPDVAVSLLVGRSGGPDDPTGVAATVHRYRILGSHGQLLLDLDSPALDLYGSTHSRILFGPTSVQAMIRSVSERAGAPTLGVAAGLSHVIDALTDAAAQHRAVAF